MCRSIGIIIRFTRCLNKNLNAVFVTKNFCQFI